MHNHSQLLRLSLSLSLSLCRHYGLVMSACSLLEELAHINSLGLSECVSPAEMSLCCPRVRYRTCLSLHTYLTFFVGESFSESSYLYIALNISSNWRPVDNDQ